LPSPTPRSRSRRSSVSGRSRVVSPPTSAMALIAKPPARIQISSFIANRVLFQVFSTRDGLEQAGFARSISDCRQNRNAEAFQDTQVSAVKIAIPRLSRTPKFEPRHAPIELPTRRLLLPHNDPFSFARAAATSILTLCPCSSKR